MLSFEGGWKGRLERANGKGEWKGRMEKANGKSEWKGRMERANGKSAGPNEKWPPWRRSFHSPFPLAVSTRRFHSPFPLAVSIRLFDPQTRAEADYPGHWPASGCQSSTLFPSGSMTQPN